MGKGFNYHVGLVLDARAPEPVTDHLDGGADDDTSEEPGAVPEEGKPEDPEEDEAVYDGRKNGEGEGGCVHPDGTRGCVGACHLGFFSFFAINGQGMGVCSFVGLRYWMFGFSRQSERTVWIFCMMLINNNNL